MSWIHIEGTLYGKQGESPAEVVDLNDLYAERDGLLAAINEIEISKKSTTDKDEDTKEAVEFWNKEKIEPILERFVIDLDKVENKINEILNVSDN